MNKLKFVDYDQFTDNEIIQTFENIIQEIETLDPSNIDNKEEIEDTKHDILKTIIWSINADDIKILGSILNKLLDLSVIKLSKTDVKNLLNNLEKTKEKTKENNPANIEHIEKMEVLLNKFANMYDDSTKWTGSIKKRRKSNIIDRPKRFDKSKTVRRKIGSNIKIKK